MLECVFFRLRFRNPSTVATYISRGKIIPYVKIKKKLNLRIAFKFNMTSGMARINYKAVCAQDHKPYIFSRTHIQQNMEHISATNLYI
jgi:hypothetical protein